MKKKIAWVTADYFIDVDLPIIPILSKEYLISWFVVINKSSTIKHESLIEQGLKKANVNLNVIYLKRRIRNILLIVEYISLISKIKRQKPDLYYVDLPGSPYFLPLFRFLVGSKKVIIATHNVSTPKGAAIERVARIYMKFTLRIFQNFHVFSNSQREILLEKYPDKNVMLAPLALKDYGDSRKNPDQSITFLNFGIIREYKRLDVLIKAAINAYENTGKKFIVKIAGACNNWEHYQSLIKYPFLFDLRIESIPNNDIADLFSTSHYFVLPYQDIAQSGAVTVALNYNLPVIASDLKPFRDIVKNEDTGFLFEAASVEKLSEIMSNILDNHDTIYQGLKNKQKLFIEENYIIDSITNKYIKFFNKFFR